MSNRYNIDTEDRTTGWAFFLSIVLTAPLYIWNGFVLKTIWNWFVPNAFANAPHLNIPQAIGLSILVSVLTLRRIAYSNEKETSLQEAMTNILADVFVGAFGLLAALIVHGML